MDMGKKITEKPGAKQTPIKTAKIRALLSQRADVKEKEIAELLNVNPQNLSRKMKAGSFDFDEMTAIGKFLGAEYHEEHDYYFVTKTGEKI